MPESDIMLIKQFFGADGGREVSNRELLDFKRAEPAGIKTLAEGIRDGSLTYAGPK